MFSTIISQSVHVQCHHQSVCLYVWLTLYVLLFPEQWKEKLISSSLCSTIISLSVCVRRLTFYVLLFPEQCKEKLISSSLCSTIIGLFDSEDGSMYEETILDLFINLCEWGKCYCNLRCQQMFDRALWILATCSYICHIFNAGLLLVYVSLLHALKCWHHWL